MSLARALVADADLLVLDEPTNHLDVDAIEWLEHELEQFHGGLVIVTHDRYVLDRVATRVLELDRGSSYVHEGGYDGYLEHHLEEGNRRWGSLSARLRPVSDVCPPCTRSDDEVELWKSVERVGNAHRGTISRKISRDGLRYEANPKANRKLSFSSAIDFVFHQKKKITATRDDQYNTGANGFDSYGM